MELSLSPDRNRILSWLDKVKIRQPIPAELEREFTVFKDIKSIDRIHTSAWLGLALTIFMFGLDIYRIKGGIYDTDPHYEILTWFHFFGLLFIIPAIHIARNKTWIIQTRLRRGIVIWGMVVLAIIFMLGQSVVIYLQRGGLVMFLGYVFVATWMFAMSHVERILFGVFSFSVMAITIFYFKQEDALADFVNAQGLLEKGSLQYPMHKKIANFIEILFLSITAFIFDAYDYNLKLLNFMAQREILKEQDRIKQLEAFKSRFFTNLTHELRTPLTMISGMAREIAEDPLRWAAEGTEVITRNAGNLLNLVNQILALSKIESGSMPLHLVRGDVLSYIGYVVDAFRGHASVKRIKLHYLAEEAEKIISYDPEKYLTILSNLLSNAIKFTPEDGNIYVQATFRTAGEEEVLELVVRDTGIGIPQEEMDHIFERFYQVQNEQTSSGIGTGIGLSLVHELVKILKGDIHVKSAEGKGTTFTVTLPIHFGEGADGRPLLKEEIRSSIHFYLPPASEQEAEKARSAQDGKPDILIIDDNADVVKYLTLCLGDLYDITIARDGQSGIDTAIHIVPDLILSDVLMPKKDGLAVCRELKQHPVTSHIPVLLLSAKADPESRIAGLEAGADVYMVKPFEKQELLMQIHNLLLRRQERQGRFVDLVVETGEGIPAENQEDQFVQKVRAVVMDHLDESDFSVTDLCRAVYLSRTQLHKKLKALTGFSATLFIGKVKLHLARKLLTGQPGLSISDIAYQTGFTDPNYFTRCYVREFNETPSETRNNNKNL